MLGAMLRRILLEVIRVSYPNLYLVGAMKGGTTTIADALMTHPDVYACPIKEPNYFCTDLYTQGLGLNGLGTSQVLKLIRRGRKLHHAYISDENVYKSLYDGAANESVVADFSTNYLYSQEAARNIARVAPNAKILIVLRNPVDRAFSEFVMNCAIGVAAPPFRKWLDMEERILAQGEHSVDHRYVYAGLYCDQVKRYFDAFPQDQIKIVLFDDLEADAVSVLNEIARFLEIRAFAGREIGGSVKESNIAIYPRLVLLNRIAEFSGAKMIVRRWFPIRFKEAVKKRYYRSTPSNLVITMDDASWLRDKFSEDMSNLSRLIGRNLDSWRV